MLIRSFTHYSLILKLEGLRLINYIALIILPVDLHMEEISPLRHHIFLLPLNLSNIINQFNITWALSL
jgi:hypothetical protein